MEQLHYLYWAVDEHGKSVASLLRGDRVEQDQRAIKRRCASMPGLKSFGTTANHVRRRRLANRIRKGQFSSDMVVDAEVGR
jgi:transposase-like protein